MTVTAPVRDTPQKLDPLGHARLTGQRAAMGGNATLTLTAPSGKLRLYADTPDDFSGIQVDPQSRDDLVRFAREILARCGEDYGVMLPPWRPAYDGRGNLSWFLARYDEHRPDIPLADQYRYGETSGILIRYVARETAQRAADKLNAREGLPYERRLMDEIVKLRSRIVAELDSQPAFGAPEAGLPALMTRHADGPNGLHLRASDTGREWTLLGSRGWVLTYEPPQPGGEEN
jgi:hypothetical protein